MQVPTTTLLSLSSTISAITSTPAVCEANDCVCVCDKRERTHTQMQNDDDAWLVLCRRCGSNAHGRFKIKSRLSRIVWIKQALRFHNTGSTCVRVCTAVRTVQYGVLLSCGTVPCGVQKRGPLCSTNTKKATPAFARCCCAPGDGCLASLPTADRPCRARAALRREGLQGITRVSF